MSSTTNGPIGPNQKVITATVQVVIDLDNWELSYGKGETPAEIAKSVVDYTEELLSEDFQRRGLTANVEVSLRV